MNFIQLNRQLALIILLTSTYFTAFNQINYLQLTKEQAWTLHQRILENKITVGVAKKYAPNKPAIQETIIEYYSSVDGVIKTRVTFDADKKKKGLAFLTYYENKLLEGIHPQNNTKPAELQRYYYDLTYNLVEKVEYGSDGYVGRKTIYHSTSVGVPERIDLFNKEKLDISLLLKGFSLHDNYSVIVKNSKSDTLRYDTVYCSRGLVDSVRIVSGDNQFKSTKKYFYYSNGLVKKIEIITGSGLSEYTEFEYFTESINDFITQSEYDLSDTKGWIGPENSTIYSRPKASFQGGYSRLADLIFQKVGQTTKVTIQGVALVSFSLSSTGVISNISIIRTPDKSYNQLIYKIVNELANQWKPAPTISHETITFAIPFLKK